MHFILGIEINVYQKGIKVRIFSDIDTYTSD